ncbi:MAG: type VI secretion system baseplate subunit TssG [Isosphaeraceae bacterium]
MALPGPRRGPTSLLATRSSGSAHPSLSFPTGAISEIRDTRKQLRDRPDSRPLEMLVSFFGLTGPSGALPRHYTEILLQQLREKDSPLCDFLDLFNHRLVSLFYRAWEKYSLPVTYERTRLDDPDGEPDPVTRLTAFSSGREAARPDGGR